MNDTPNPPTDGELADRILAAVNHGLRFAEADPDSVLPETVNAVLAAVQPELDRLRTELASTQNGAPLTCGASETNSLGVVGPCVLRFHHNGPVHQDAAGAKWWLTARFATGTVEA